MPYSTMLGLRVLPRNIAMPVSTNRYILYDAGSDPSTIATKFLFLEFAPITINPSWIVYNFIR